MLYAPWTANLEPNPADPILQGYRIRDARGIVVAEAFNRPYPVIVEQEHAALIAAAPAMRDALLTIGGKLSALADADNDDSEMHIRADMEATLDAALALAAGHAPDAAPAAPQTPDASALMLAALRDVETRLCDIWERRPEMRGEIAKSRDVVEAAIAAAEGAADA